MTKAIIVSDEQAYYDFFAVKFPSWNIQHPVPNINTMWEQLENKHLDENSEIVVLTGAELSDKNNFLEVTIRTLASEALVLVILEKEYQTLLDKKIDTLTVIDNIPCGKFWYIDPSAPVSDVKKALEEYEQIKQTHTAETPATPSNTYQNQPLETYNSSTPTNNFNDVISQAKEWGTTPDIITSDTPHTPPQAPVNTNIGNSTIPVRKGFVLASTSSKGGSGKSTVALCTASMFYHSSRIAYEQGLRDRPLDIVVVDMDTRDGQIGFFVGTTSPSVLNIVVGQDYSREAIMKNLVKNENLGIHTLLAPKRAATADYATPETYLTIISQLRTMFDIIILDTSVNYLDPLIRTVVLPEADAVMFVTTLSKGSVFGMTRWIQEVTEAYNVNTPPIIGKDKIGVIINQTLANVNIEMSNIKEAAEGIGIITAIPMDSQAVINATNSLRLDEIVLRHPTISPAYFDIVDTINNSANDIFTPQPLIAPLSVKKPEPKTSESKPSRWFKGK